MGTTFDSGLQQSNSQGKTRSTPSRIVKIVAALLLLMLALAEVSLSWNLNCVREGSDPCSLDFYMFWTTARTLQNNESANLYLPTEAVRLAEQHFREAQSSGIPRLQGASAHVEELDPISTPFLFSSFALWVSDDYTKDLLIYFIGCVGCYLGALWFLMRRHNLSELTKGVVLVCFFFPLTPAAYDLQVGNVNAIQLAVSCSIFALTQRNSSRGRDILLGAIMATLTLFKPNIAPMPFLFSIHLLRQGRTVEFTRVVLGAGIATLLVHLMVFESWPPGSPWLSWFDTIQNRFASHVEANPADGSLATLLGNAIPSNVRWDAIIIGIVIALSMLITLRLPRQHDTTISVEKEIALRHQDSLILHVGLVAGVVCSKPMWLHYNVLIVPAIFELIFPLHPCARAQKLQPIARRLTLIVLVIGVHFLGRLLGVPNAWMLGVGSHTLYTLFILVTIIQRLQATSNEVGIPCQNADRENEKPCFSDRSLAKPGASRTYLMCHSQIRDSFSRER